MKKGLLVLMLILSAGVFAQQLPDSHFENWSKKFNGDAQLNDWNGSNVSQIGVKFTFMYQKDGRTGFCAYITDRAVGIPKLNLGATGPGYMSLGEPWQYLKGLNLNSATAGTTGGIVWTYRPDTISVWIKRVGPNWDKEDFHVLYYAWKGTTIGTHYKNKNGGCTEIEKVNEESDIRSLLDGNECGTDIAGKQICEGWLRARAEYTEWTQVKVPIFYLNDETPEMCNVIFSAGNYPAFRANDGLYDGNAMYIDDVELIYSSKIHKLVINGEEIKGFKPNATNQTFRIHGDGVQIKAYRGVGSLTNIRGKKVQFEGRQLSENEMTIEEGAVNGAPYVITVKSEDGKSKTTYRIKLTK